MSLGKILVLVGPTAAGKSRLAVRLADEIGAEIITADSMQVYRDLDIGTAKPSTEERAGIPHHLIDIADPDETFHAARYQKEADRTITEVLARGHVPFVVGGTGLYVKALLHGLFHDPTPPRHERWRDPFRGQEQPGEDPRAMLNRLDPATAERIHPNDSARTRRALEVLLKTGRSITALQKDHGFRENRYRALLLGLSLPREELYRRINARADWMVEQGLLEEVRSLLGRGTGRETPAMRGLGYRHMVQFLQGSIPLEDAVETLKRDTRHYAKRQITWFCNQEKVTWFQSAQVLGISDRIQEFFSAV